MTSIKVMDVFRGTFVYILTRTLRSGQQKKSGPLIIEGFLIDCDEHHYFLGMTPDEITECVKEEDVVRIFLPIEELTEILAITDIGGSGELN